jgi:hypothetical protein
LCTKNCTKKGRRGEKNERGEGIGGEEKNTKGASEETARGGEERKKEKKNFGQPCTIPF